MWLSTILTGAARALLGASARWQGSPPTLAQRLYFANHTSHADTIVLWSALPAPLRKRTRPVAAADYWGASAARRFIALKGLNAVLIKRGPRDPNVDPLAPLYEALDAGQSLILFPEGTRGHEALPGPFKSGLFHLAQRYPNVELIPVYLENLHRSLPKGEWLPVPLNCAARFGAPLARVGGEDKQAFLERARAAVVELSR
ncbi:MAG: 1-acyl-sn-glycerol-3-phosphate acyltransferase [Bradyrhizobium sp.]|nr:MAG: 1-acyl-sn-glycerol-3-phosphate acyltransferase [Bradyrhizobium sp.]